MSTLQNANLQHYLFEIQLKHQYLTGALKTLLLHIQYTTALL